MSWRYILLYHSIYWIYRIFYTLALVRFLYKEDHYFGAIAVQFVLMPFFYINYAVLVPFLLTKQVKRYIINGTLWVMLFILTYGSWTSLRGYLLTSGRIVQLNLTETLNNLIYIWLVSSCFCLFEHWVKMINKNKELAILRSEFLSKTNQNRKLNHLLATYFDYLEHTKIENLPFKIIQTSDFFKHILYNNSRKVFLEEEIQGVQFFSELMNISHNKFTLEVTYLQSNLKVESFLLKKVIALIRLDTPPVNYHLKVYQIGSDILKYELSENSLLISSDCLSLKK